MHQAGDERFVAGLVPQLGGQLPGGDGPRQRRSPVPLELLGRHLGKQLVRQAESEHQQPQRLVAQDRERLVQIGHFPPQAEERAVHDAEDFAGQRRVLLEQLLEHARIDLRLAGEPDDFERHGRAAVERRSAGGDLLNAGGDVVHGRWSR